MRNRYPGSCRTCRVQVPADAGAAVKESGRWRVYCSEHAPEDAPPGPAGPPRRGDHPGWHTLDLAGYDSETSSNNPDKAFLVSAALVDASGSARTWLVDPGDREIPAEAVAIHGISTERARDEGMPAEQALEEIADALAAHLRAGRGLVIFNAPFDLGVLENELRRRDMKSLAERLGSAPRPIIDPLVIDRGIDPFRKGPRNLGAMCGFYGVELTEAHTAVADAAACLSLSREIGARHADVAGLDLHALHDRQVDWALDYARRRQEWLERSRPGRSRVIDGTWPISVSP